MPCIQCVVRCAKRLDELLCSFCRTCYADVYRVQRSNRPGFEDVDFKCVIGFRLICSREQRASVWGKLPASGVYIGTLLLSPTMQDVANVMLILDAP